MKRLRIGALVAIVAMLGALLAGTTAGAASPKSAGIKGRAYHVSFRGTRAALTKHVARAAASGGGAETPSSARAELPFLSRPVGPEEGGSQPTTAGAIPHSRNLPVRFRDASLLTSFQASNHFDSRFSMSGNQFSLEPPDQGLCVGNGYVMETVNNVVQVFTESGTPLITGNPGVGSGPVGLSTNEFYGYVPAIDRTSGVYGPFLFDVSCTYDQASQRFFHLAGNLAQDPDTGAFTGASTLDLAVSQTSNPLGAWNFYSIDSVNDGTGGTPNHNCDLGPCFPDYPKLAADTNGIYITTNEYSFFADQYTGAQLYALSKADLVAGASSPRTVYFENLAVPSLGQLGFTMLAAQSRADSYVNSHGGVEYFLSSTAGAETGNTTGASNKIVVWALSDTSSLGSSSPSPSLQQTVVTTNRYVLPPLALQRSGPTPLLTCINLGLDCVGDPAPFQQAGPYPLDGSDTRTMTAFLDGGTLWGAVDTAIRGAGGSTYSADNNFAPTPVNRKVGVLYFAIRPRWDDGELEAHVVQQDYLAVDGGNLTYPSIATTNGVGFVGMTLIGAGRFPSAVYVKIGLGMKPTAVRIAARGVGPDDGFTGTFEGGLRPRWGDYGYAAPGANGTLWFASEYIAQRCSFWKFSNDTTCDGTRSFWANWSTRISQLKP